MAKEATGRAFQTKIPLLCFRSSGGKHGREESPAAICLRGESFRVSAVIIPGIYGSWRGGGGRARPREGNSG